MNSAKTSLLRNTVRGVALWVMAFSYTPVLGSVGNPIWLRAAQRRAIFGLPDRPSREPPFPLESSSLLWVLSRLSMEIKLPYQLKAQLCWDHIVTALLASRTRLTPIPCMTRL